MADYLDAATMDYALTFGALQNGPYPGRRLRVLAKMLRITYDRQIIIYNRPVIYWHESILPTYREVYNYVHSSDAEISSPEVLQFLHAIPLVNHGAGTPESEECRDNVIEPLQDLGDQVIFDITEAAESLVKPDIFYPGIDLPRYGLKPVTDEHVERVMWAMNRELKKELRGRDGNFPVNSSQKLPALDLSKFPKRVQRALAERRRYRFYQWGITQETWERGTWSLFDVQEDPDWKPAKLVDWQVNTPPPKADADRAWPTRPPYTPPPDDYEAYYD